MPTRNEIAEELSVQYYKSLPSDEAGYDKKFFIAIVTDAYGEMRRNVVKEKDFARLLSSNFPLVKSLANTYPNETYKEKLKPKKNVNGKWVIEYPTSPNTSLGGASLLSISNLTSSCCSKIIISQSQIFDCLGGKKPKVKPNQKEIELINFTDDMLSDEYEITLITESPDSDEGDFDIPQDWSYSVRLLATELMNKADKREQEQLNDGLDSPTKSSYRIQSIMNNNKSDA